MADHLAALREAMAAAGIDAVLLAAPAAAAAIVGHRRVAVHGPSTPLPTAIVTASWARPPIALTPDPDGAPDHATVALHGLAWNPATLIGTLHEALGRAATGTIALDVVSPGALALLRDALPDARLVDATAVVTTALLRKGEREVAALGKACAVAHRAAFAAEAAGTVDAAVDHLDGAFPIADLIADGDRVVVEIVVDGYAGVARLGPGDVAALTAAVDVIGSGVGTCFGELAGRLPAGVEVSGLGRGHELPRLNGGDARHHLGHATPPGVVLQAGAVLLVRSGEAAVTVHVTGGGAAALLSPTPAEVVR